MSFENGRRLLADNRAHSRAKRLWAIVLCALAFTQGTALSQEASKEAAKDSPSSSPIATTLGASSEGGYNLKVTGAVEAANWDAQGVSPSFRVKFSVERADGEVFRELKIGDLEASLAKEAINLREDDLKRASSADSSLVLALDTSGSMHPPANRIGVDKFKAAKAAITYFLKRLRPQDSVEIIVFDKNVRTIFPMSSDKVAAGAAIEKLQIATDGSQNNTALYDALHGATQAARKHKARNVILITDGMDDTPFMPIPSQAALRSFSAPQRAEFDTRRRDYSSRTETKIFDLIGSDAEVRIYTVGIGDRNAPVYSADYVDLDTLSRISDRTRAGTNSYFVDLPDLVSVAKVDPRRADTKFIDVLSAILDRIQQDFYYDYVLTLRPALAGIAKNQPIPVEVVTTLDAIPASLGRVQLPMGFSFTVGSNGELRVDLPKVGSSKILSFIPPASEKIGLAALVMIYGRFVLILFLLALIPALLRTIAGWKKRSVAKGSMLIVPAKSPHIGKECPNEQRKLGSGWLIKKGDVIIECPKCKTVHHVGCWHMTGDCCWIRGCRETVPLSPAVVQEYGLDEELVGSH